MEDNMIVVDDHITIVVDDHGGYDGWVHLPSFRARHLANLDFGYPSCFSRIKQP